jgi:threonine dehydrogenase-like Zn-dependent dehydrogenase
VSGDGVETGAGAASSGSAAYDVVVVGGGPAGCSAAIFTARYGLETLVFDRGTTSLGRCAHLENYLGFPAGIDIPRFYDLMHDHVAEAGAELVADLVESVTRRADGADGTPDFLVETQDGRAVTARRVVAATRYDADYLRPLDDPAMFEDDDPGEYDPSFDYSYPAADGSTPVEGLFVASPSDAAARQVIIAAGKGARVGLAVVEAVRGAEGVPEPLVTPYDWRRPETELAGEWAERSTWCEYVDAQFPADSELSESRRVELREREIDRRFDQYVSAAERERRAARAQERLLDHVDDERILERARHLDARRDDASADE